MRRFFHDSVLANRSIHRKSTGQALPVRRFSLPTKRCPHAHMSPACFFRMEKRDRMRPAAARKKRKIRTSVRLRTLDSDDVAPQVGLEPTTLRLTAECSAIELLRNIALLSLRTELLYSARGALSTPVFRFFEKICACLFPPVNGNCAGAVLSLRRIWYTVYIKRRFSH